VILVSLDDVPGVNLVGNVHGVDPHEVKIGARVRVVFEDVADPASGERLLVPQWELVREPSGSAQQASRRKVSRR
jgi:hypothetical protein